MKLLVAFSTLLALGLGSNLRYDELKFAQFKEQFGKQYQTRSDIRYLQTDQTLFVLKLLKKVVIKPSTPGLSR